MSIPEEREVVPGGGVVPVIVRGVSTRDVLMLAWNVMIASSEIGAGLSSTEAKR